MYIDFTVFVVLSHVGCPRITSVINGYGIIGFQYFDLKIKQNRLCKFRQSIQGTCVLLDLFHCMLKSSLIKQRCYSPFLHYLLVPSFKKNQYWKYR